MTRKHGNKLKTKVIIFIPSLNVGGAENVVRQLAINLDRQKFDCHVCCITEEGVFANSIHEAGVPVKAFNKKSRWDVFVWFKVYRFLKELAPCIVHSFLFTAGFWVSIPAFLAADVLPIYSIRSIYGQNPKWVAFLEKFFILPFSKRITFVSHNALESYLRKQPSLGRKSVVIPNGVDLAKFGQTNVTPHNNRIIAVGRLDKAKGYDILLRAYQVVKEQRPSSTLVIVGEGSCREKLELLAQELGLDPKAIFIGQSQNIPQLLSSSSIYVSASLWEGIPNSHLEAMASGKAIVATAVGGVPEILDSESALLIASKNVGELARAIIALLDNPDLRERLSNHALERVNKEFSLDRMIFNHENFYQDLMKGLEKNRELIQ